MLGTTNLLLLLPLCSNLSARKKNTEKGEKGKKSEIRRIKKERKKSSR